MKMIEVRCGACHGKGCTNCKMTGKLKIEEQNMVCIGCKQLVDKTDALISLKIHYFGKGKQSYLMWETHRFMHVKCYQNTLGMNVSSTSDGIPHQSSQTSGGKGLD